MKLFNKKAQVTLFVVIGLALLIIGGLALFLIQNNTPEISYEIKETDELNSMIKQCLNDLSKEAIIIAGRNSGFVYPEELPLEHDFIATKSNYLNFGTGVLPYWYYVDDNSGTSKSFKPPLCYDINCISQNNFGYGSIQQQIQYYINSKIQTCANIEKFEGIVDIQRSYPSSYVEIAKETIIINLNWPHNITKSGKTEKFEDFTLSHEVRLADMYQLADKIVNNERYDTQFSDQTMSMISLYSGIDDILPPISAITYSSALGSNKIWLAIDVKNIISNEIIPLMQLFQITNTENYQEYSSDSDNSIFEEGIYSGFDIIADEEMVSGLKPKFIIPPNEPQVTINQGQQVIRAEKLTSGSDFLLKLMGLSVNRYKAIYSLSYPVVFTIYDKEAFNGEGFEFSVAFEVNIWNNKPSSTPFDEYQANFRSNEDSTFIDLYELDDEEFTVRVKNRRTGEGIRGATVSYLCVEENILGRTDSEGYVSGKIPYCLMGGEFSVFHIDYSDISMPFDHDGTIHELDFSTYEIKTKNVEVFKNHIIEEQYEITDVEDDDLIMLIIEPLDQTWPSVQVISLGNTSSTNKILNTAYQNPEIQESLGPDFEFETEESEESNLRINLVPGNYEITGYLIHTSPVHLAEGEMCAVDVGFIEIGCETFPAKTYDQWPSGGFYWNGLITEDMIYDDNTFKFVLQELTLPTVHDGTIGQHIWSEEYKESNEHLLVIE